MATNVMQVEVSVPANGSINNVFQGERFERLPYDALVDLAVTGSATGLSFELNIGGRSVSPRIPASIQNRAPIIPDDVVVSDIEGFVGELVQLTAANSTGAPLTLFARVNMEEAEEDDF